jgi:hypothetical protein
MITMNASPEHALESSIRSAGECVTNTLNAITTRRYPNDVRPYVGEETGLKEMPRPPRTLSAYRANMYESSSTDDASKILRILAAMIIKAMSRRTKESVFPTSTLCSGTVPWSARVRDRKSLIIDLTIYTTRSIA